MKKNNNSVSQTESNQTKTQAKSASSNFSIAVASAHGITNTKLDQNMVNYSMFKEELIAFKEVIMPYTDEIIINNTPTKLNTEEALKYSHKLAKSKAKWFIAGEFDPQTRHTENLKYRSAIVLDLDEYDGDITALEEAIKKELSNYTYVAYSTASHKKNKPKVRIFLPTSGNIPTDEYDGVVRAFVHDLSFKGAIDNASFKPNQFMFFSSIVKIIDLPEGVVVDKYEPWTIDNEAELVDPANFKKKLTQGCNKTPSNISSRKPSLSLVKNTSASNGESSISPPIESEEERQRSINLTATQITSNLEEYPALELAYDEWLEVGMALHHYYNGAEQGLTCFDEWSKQDTKRYSHEDIESKWRSFGNSSTTKPLTFLTVLKKIKNRRIDQFDKEIFAAIAKLTDKVRGEELAPILKAVALNCSEEEAEYYIREIKAKTNLGVVRLRSILVTERRKIRAEKLKQRGERIYPLNEQLPPELFGEYIDGKSPKNTIENFGILLKNYGLDVRRNVISKKDEIIIPAEEYLQETAAAAKLARLTSLCENNSLSKLHLIPEYCTERAAENPYNPITDWIKSKPWDGIDRLQSLYDTVITKDEFLKEDKDFFIRKWLISFIAASEEKNGVFSKGVLIFQGEQSIGKTAWFKKLLPDPVSEYFLEGATLDPTNKDSKATVTSHALVELGEADSTMKKDIAAIKAFLTSKKDTFRPVYARVDSQLPRRTIFCASVNDNEYLVDPTGNSRFWTIPVLTLNYDHDIDMQQLWSQVLELYNSGEQWWLDQAGEKILAKYNDQHVKTCPYKELIVDRYVFPQEIADDNKENSWLSATDIYIALGINGNLVSGSRTIASVLSSMGAIRSPHNKKFLVCKHPDYKPVKKVNLLGEE